MGEVKNYNSLDKNIYYPYKTLIFYLNVACPLMRIKVENKPKCLNWIMQTILFSVQKWKISNL